MPDDTQAGEAYLHVLRGILSGVSMHCDPLDLPAQYQECIHRNKVGGWPPSPLGVTMAGLMRMASLQSQLKEVKEKGIPGDILEAGVWRGGMSIYAAAVMRVYKLDRKMYLCDSFKGLGLPQETSLRPDEHFYASEWLNGTLAVAQEHVLHNLDVHGIPRSRAVLVPGYFVDSLPPLRASLTSAKGHLALLRMDGDMYDSTIDILYNLYDFVPVGGLVVVDDWGWDHGAVQGSDKVAKPIFGAKQAVMHFRELHGMTEPMRNIDYSAAWWRKEKEVQLRRDLYLRARKEGQKVLVVKEHTEDEYYQAMKYWEAAMPVAETLAIRQMVGH